MDRARATEAPVRAGLDADPATRPDASAAQGGGDAVAPRGLFVVALGLVAILGAVLGYRQITSPDLGFHLATARWIAAHGWVPSTDAFTYTVADHAYVDLQWLFQLVVYGLESAGGAAALALMTALMTLAFAGVSLARAWRRNGSLGAGSLVLVLLFFLGNHWEPRPHLFSWLYGAVALWILEENARGARRFLPLLPVVLVLWVNTHSLFVLGLVIIGTYVASHVAQRFTRDGVVWDRSLLLWSGVATLACLVNPYHVRGLLFPLVQLADIQGSSAYKALDSGIAEFMSPFRLDGYHHEGHLVLFGPSTWWHAFTLLALVGLWRERRRANLAEWVLFAGFLYVFWSANKNFGYFVMAVFPTVAAGLGAARGTAERPAVASRPALAAVAGICVVLIGLVWSGRLYELAWSSARRGTGFNAAVLPVEAASFLRDNGIEGRVLNTWNDGGYLAWTTEQPVTVYSHGEVMGQETYRRYVRAKRPGEFEAALADWEPDVAVVPYKSVDYWLFHLFRSSDWRLVMSNERTALFLRDTVAPEVPALSAPAPSLDFPVFLRADLERLVGEATVKPRAGFAAWMRGAAAFPSEAVARAGFHLQTGRTEAATGIAVEALQRTPHAVPDLLLILGHALNAQRLYELADECFSAFLRHEDDPALARGIQEARRGR